MATRAIKLMKPELANKLIKMVGLKCILQRIGDDRSLFVGFGELHSANSGRSIIPHAEWEIGSYDCGWRVARDGEIVCGKDDTIDDIRELKDRFSNIQLGSFVSLYNFSDFDTRIMFSCGTIIDILGTMSDDDEILHMFFPDNEVATFSIREGWLLGRSDRPWK